MKTIKMMLLLSTIAFFTSVTFEVEAKDCSHLIKLHKKLLCKTGSDKYDSERSSVTVKTEKIKEVKTEKIKKEGVLKRLKDLGKHAESFNEKNDSLVDIFKKEKD